MRLGADGAGSAGGGAAAVGAAGDRSGPRRGSGGRSLQRARAVRDLAGQPSSPCAFMGGSPGLDSNYAAFLSLPNGAAK